ncbi:MULTISPECIES: DUF2267 domain-containing protein [unclassified Streptomyces]|uniref:DUF2267 domain-containing protein n=1 Tax=unclassified Streptomyces TaxID=2593676 RepID=UPI003684DDD6
MRHDEMIGKVRTLARLPDSGTAERATRAVVSTLSERLPSGLARHVAAQLPPDLAAAMRRAADAAGAGSGHAGERFGLAVFAGRIADRAGTDEDTALREAAAVLEVLDAALAPELTERMAGALPSDIRELLPVERATGDHEE